MEELSLEEYYDYTAADASQYPSVQVMKGRMWSMKNIACSVARRDSAELSMRLHIHKISQSRTSSMDLEIKGGSLQDSGERSLWLKIVARDELKGKKGGD
ncbi:hypothetical protein OIU79_011656 [Salix purpurea]|uniref:Uncharacterized protein n=1 Tax=Salix purpurea TaxID=77065 RepID=A0A9Q0Q1D1_SALPP|nr:hypothetical protein OIU79_011656 [Salix purpurea]